MEQSFRPNEVKLIYPIKELPKEKIENSLSAFEFALRFYDKDTIQHHLTTKIILIDSNNKVLGVATISESAHTYDIVEIKFILQSAILSNAKGVILVSNCTDEDVEPHKATDLLKEQIKKAVNLFDIQLVDYMLITHDNYYSYDDNKRL